MGAKQLIMFTRKLTVLFWKNPNTKMKLTILILIKTLLMVNTLMLRKLSTNCLAAFSIMYFLQVKWQAISSTHWLVKKSMNETKLHCFHEQSEVKFGELNDEVITAYVESEEPL